jgi:hypothetical protein
MGCSSSKVEGVEIPWDETVSPTADEQQVYAEVAEVMGRTAQVRQTIDEYKGCQELARAAMSTPTPETEKAAFEGLLLAVDSISEFFGLAKDFEAIFIKLLAKLGSAGVQGGVVPLDQYPGLTRQLAELIDFSLEFDRVRMLRPNLSNDFSYYRRLLPKFSKHPDIKVKDDEASGMALFTAEHIPMITALSRSGQRAQESNDTAAMVLATLTNSCLLKLRTKTLNDETAQMCARVMTGSLVLFDHVDQLGAFHNKAPVSVKQTVLLLKRDFPKSSALISAIHFSSKNFKSAPDSIQQLFE